MEQDLGNMVDVVRPASQGIRGCLWSPSQCGVTRCREGGTVGSATSSYRKVGAVRGGSSSWSVHSAIQNAQSLPRGAHCHWDAFWESKLGQLLDKPPLTRFPTNVIILICPVCVDLVASKGCKEASPCNFHACIQITFAV